MPKKTGKRKRSFSKGKEADYSSSDDEYQPETSEDSDDSSVGEEVHKTHKKAKSESEYSSSDGESDPTEEGDEMDTTGSTTYSGENPLLSSSVLSVVMKFFNVLDLKSCRLVNATWNVPATSCLKRRSVVRFNYVFQQYRKKDRMDNSLSKINVDGWGHRLPIYLKEMTHWDTKNYSIVIRREEFDCPPPKSAVSSDFGMLFEALVDKMKYLEFKNDSVFDKSTKLFEETLSNNFSKLTHLRVEINWLSETVDNRWESLVLKSLPSVQNLEFNLSRSTSGKAIVPFKSEDRFIVQRTLEATPNLTSLTIKSNEIKGSYSFKSEEFADTIYDQLKILPNLSAVIIKPNSFPSISSLSKLPLNLKRLGLLIPKLVEAVELETLFTTQAPTLEELELIIRPLARILDKPIEVSMPAFPKLRKLQIQNLDLWSDTPIGLSIKFVFLNDELVYENQFPLLEELSLSNARHRGVFRTSWENFKAFFPDNGQVVEKIRVLNVPYLAIHRIPRAKKIDLKSMIRLAKMFPSIRHPSFRLAKNQYKLNRAPEEYSAPKVATIRHPRLAKVQVQKKTVRDQSESPPPTEEMEHSVPKLRTRKAVDYSSQFE